MSIVDLSCDVGELQNKVKNLERTIANLEQAINLINQKHSRQIEVIKRIIDNEHGNIEGSYFEEWFKEAEKW